MKPMQGDILFVVYQGASMNLTLAEPDILEIIPYASPGRAITAGDIIYFDRPETGRSVVHRVVRVEEGKIRTRGDNNRNDDLWLVEPEMVRGRVVRALRGRSSRQIAGGRTGVVFSFWMRLRKRFVRAVLKILPLTGFRTGIRQCAKWLPARWKSTHFVSYTSQGRNRMQLHWRRCAIGLYDRQIGRWVIRRPFRWLIDLERLPEPDTPSAPDPQGQGGLPFTQRLT